MASSDMTVKLKVDTTELDAALARIEALARMERSLTENRPLGHMETIAVGVGALAGSQRRLSRRNLLGLGLLRRS